MSLMQYLKLLRPHQWSKNLFLFIPAFFAQEISNPEILIRLTFGFIAFCLLSSSVYIINDLRDVEQDKQHPQKKTRPIAAGLVNPFIAKGLSVALILISLALASVLSSSFFYLCLGYLALNIAYTFLLKGVSLIDVIIIALGFEIRVFAGGAISMVMISEWLGLMVFLLALFLGFAKRRDDLMVLENGQPVRESARNYNLPFLNSALSVLASVIVVSYIMYSRSNPLLEKAGQGLQFYTSIFVVLGMIRYLQITFVEMKSGQPSVMLLRDPFILANVILWVACNYLILYWL